jgi:hypothetical protein
MTGDLDFVNLPLSVDFSKMETIGGRSFYRDLRPDYHDADYDLIARNIIVQMLERKPLVPTVMIVTHNDNDFTNSEDRVAYNMHRSLSSIFKACHEEGYTPVGATIETICTMVRERSNPTHPEFIKGHASIQAGR